MGGGVDGHIEGHRAAWEEGEVWMATWRATAQPGRKEAPPLFLSRRPGRCVAHSRVQGSWPARLGSFLEAPEECGDQIGRGHGRLGTSGRGRAGSGDRTHTCVQNWKRKRKKATANMPTRMCWKSPGPEPARQEQIFSRPCQEGDPLIKLIHTCLNKGHRFLSNKLGHSKKTILV